MEKGNLTPQNAKSILKNQKEFMSKNAKVAATGNNVKANPDAYFMTNVAAYENKTKALLMAGLTKMADPNAQYISNVAQAEDLRLWLNEGLVEDFDKNRGHDIMLAAEKENQAKIIEMQVQKDMKHRA